MNAPVSSVLAPAEPARSVDVAMVRTRLWWLLKPMGALGLTLWVLHPAVADRADVTALALLAFLLGVAYGLVLFGHRFAPYLHFQPLTGRHQGNRLPAEYYWGEISHQLFENR